MKYLLLVLLVSSVSAFSSFTITLSPNRKDCYFERLVKNDRLEISYEVSSGGHLEIDFSLKDPNGNLIHSTVGEPSTAVQYLASIEGRHEYCFFNRVGSQDKTITFVVRGPDERSKIETKYRINDGWFTLTIATHEPLENGIRDLIDHINEIRDKQSYLVNREYTHRKSKFILTKAAESTKSRVLWWAIIQIGVLIAVCAFQVLYLKGFFQVRRIVM